jgi:FMN reductase
MIKVLGVSSSMRDPSFSAKGLEIALQNAKNNGAEVKFLKLSETPLPMFYSEPKNDENVTLVTEMVKWADAFILATPDYHGSMSGSMKNFLDYYWSEFAGKLFGYICASHEKGLTAMDQMRTAIRQCYGWSVPYGVSINGDEDFENGTIKNSKLNSRLNMLSRDLTVYGEIIRKQFLNDLDANVSNSFSSHYKE